MTGLLILIIALQAVIVAWMVFITLLIYAHDKDIKLVDGLYEKVESFEKGTDTVLTREFDDRGEVLSVGQQQKLHLARVFAFNSPFVLLDEPSSALDPVAEYKMFENMLKATENKSVVFISS